MRNCERVMDNMVCGKPFATNRIVAVMASVSAISDLEYSVDLCEDHADEYDRDHV